MKFISIILLLLTLSLSFCHSKQEKNNIPLEELLTKQRTQYIANFQAGLAQYKTAKSAIEVMLQITADQNRHLPELYQLHRYDLVNVNSDGKFDPIEFNLDKDSVLKFDKQVYKIKDMTVTVSPFVWNGCELTIDKNPGFVFDNWAKKWMDMEDRKKPGPDGFQGVIHSITYPKENGTWSTSIDFGTAPVQAFIELLRALSNQGIKKVEVHSNTFLNL